MGQGWPAAGLGALLTAVCAWGLSKEVTTISITSTIVWPHPLFSSSLHGRPVVQASLPIQSQAWSHRMTLVNFFACICIDLFMITVCSSLLPLPLQDPLHLFFHLWPDQVYPQMYFHPNGKVAAGSRNRGSVLPHSQPQMRVASHKGTDFHTP